MADTMAWALRSCLDVGCVNQSQPTALIVCSPPATYRADRALAHSTALVCRGDGCTGDAKTPGLAIYSLVTSCSS